MEGAVLVAKMNMSQVTKTFGTDGKQSGEQINMSAVYGAQGTANAQWSKYTPSGRLELQVSNPDAFESAKEIGVDPVQRHVAFGKRRSGASMGDQHCHPCGVLLGTSDGPQLSRCNRDPPIADLLRRE